MSRFKDWPYIDVGKIVEDTFKPYQPLATRQGSWVVRATVTQSEQPNKPKKPSKPLKPEDLKWIADRRKEFLSALKDIAPSVLQVAEWQTNHQPLLIEDVTNKAVGFFALYGGVRVEFIALLMLDSLTWMYTLNGIGQTDSEDLRDIESVVKRGVEGLSEHFRKIAEEAISAVELLIED